MKDKEITYKDYVPRDVSWMFFNRRILQEAMKPHVPLLERLGFLGIYSNNLDEFFRVRVALLNRIAECDDKETREERREAIQTLKAISRLNSKYSKEYETAIRQVESDLREENICLSCRRPLAQERYIAHVLFPPYIYNMRNPIRLLCSFHPRMAIAASSALGLVEHFDCGQHRLLVACDDELRDALSVVDGEGVLREVDEQHH